MTAPRHGGMTRRTVLKSSVGAAAAALLAACGGAAPTPTPAPTAKPTTAAASSAPTTSAATTGAPTTAAASVVASTAASGSAVAGGTTTPASGTAAATTATSAQAKKGGTLKISQPIPITPFEFQQLGPHTATTILGVFDTLVRFDDKQQPQPWLAQSWSYNADKTELTLKLQQGVMYHTGREFTSDDVQFNLQRVQDPKVASQLAGQAKTITNVTLPDKYTAVLRFAQPNPAIFNVFDLLAIVDKETAADLPSAKQVIGTGPFVWKDYTPGSKVTLARNDKYWQSGKPYLDGIDLQITDDKQSMVAAVESGQRDIAWQVLPQDMSRLKNGQQAMSVVSNAGSQFYYIGVNTQGDGVTDKRVRQAFEYAIDRKRIADTLLFGLVPPQTIAWPRTSPAYNADIDATAAFDLNKTKALFQAANVAPGTTFTLEANAQDPINGKIGQIVQADLASINIKLDIQNIENSVFQQKLQQAGFKQLFGNTEGFSNFFPGAWFITAYPVRIPDNAAKFTAPEYTDLIRQMQTETDPAKLKALYDQMNKMLIDQAFNLCVSEAPAGWVIQKSVQGFSYNTFNYIKWDGLWINK
jgi:peptide/nickel transport system substrate-binding protein